MKTGWGGVFYTGRMSRSGHYLKKEGGPPVREILHFEFFGYSVTSVASIAPVSSTVILNFLLEPEVEEDTIIPL